MILKFYNCNVVCGNMQVLLAIKEIEKGFFMRDGDIYVNITILTISCKDHWKK